MTGFYAHHFPVSQLRDGCAYLLSVAILPSPSPTEGSYPASNYGLVGRLWPRFEFKPSNPLSPVIAAEVNVLSGGR